MSRATPLNVASCDGPNRCGPCWSIIATIDAGSHWNESGLPVAVDLEVTYHQADPWSIRSVEVWDMMKFRVTLGSGWRIHCSSSR
jgi:hypothetical protein